MKDKGLSLVEVRRATSDEWDLIWRECEYATYFHSREWAEIWGAYSKGGMIPEPKLVSFSDGKKVLLPLTVQQSRRGFGKTYYSSPGGTYGGWLSSERLHEAHAALLVSVLGHMAGNLIWRSNPYDELVLQTVSKIKTEYDETDTLHLADDFESLLKAWTKGHVSAARKAQKAGVAGVKVLQAATLEEWYAYFQVYEDSLHRWGEKATSKYEWTLFEEMHRRKSPNIRLWLAVYQDNIIAGALCFYSSKHAVYWHGAALEEHFHLRPVNLLMFEAIKDACERGLMWFDFNPSGGHEGVRKFKRSFGTQALPCPVVRRVRLSNSVAYRLWALLGGR